MTEMVVTTKGPIEASALARTLGFEDRPERYVVWIEWRYEGELVRRDCFPLLKTLGDEVETAIGVVPATSLHRAIELRDDPDEIVVVEQYVKNGLVVKRSAHVVLKHATVEATLVAGGF